MCAPGLPDTRITGADTQVHPYSPMETSRGAFQEPTLIRHGFAVPPSPLEGEGYLHRGRFAFFFAMEKEGRRPGYGR